MSGFLLIGEMGERKKSCVPPALGSPGNYAVSPSEREKEGREKSAAAAAAAAATSTAAAAAAA